MPMFDANRVLIEAFIASARQAYREIFPNLGADYDAGLERAARTALVTLRRCDCAYHDLEHTLLVTDAGLAILRGRQLARGDLTPHSWLQAVVGMLFHDVGYLRGLLRDDRSDGYLIDDSGRRIATPPGATDAFMTPFHVSRGRMFVLDRFATDTVIDAPTVASYIEMTRFPVPLEPVYQELDSIGALVRAADLIGQMADPNYPMKQARLFSEFHETGEAQRLGYENAAELRADFPTFFYRQVHPYLPAALEYLRMTPEGEQWVANLIRHLHGERMGSERIRGQTTIPSSLEELMERRAAPMKPHIAFRND
jgi:hypothetical protein